MIRPYQKKDFDRLIEILSLNIPASFAVSELEDLKEYLNNYIEDYFVLEKDGLIIGAAGINYKNNNTEAYLSWDFIDPKFQGKGFGKALVLHRLEKILAQKSISKIVVRTSQMAFQFYEKNGFSLKQVEKNYWAEGYDLYFMEYDDTTTKPM